MKDHEIKQLVNDLTQIARTYHDCEQLRENIAIRVRAAFQDTVLSNAISGASFTGIIRDEIGSVYDGRIYAR